MPTRSSQENMDIVLSVVRDNQGISRKELIRLSGLKLWAISPNVTELKEMGELFSQKDSGKDKFYTMDYATENNIPPRVFKGGKVRKDAPKVKPVSILAGQKYFDSLFQVAQ